MKNLIRILACILITCGVSVTNYATDNTLTELEKSQGFKLLFDGKTLNGWAGLKDYWTVRSNAIVGRTTKEKPLKENSFLVYVAEEFGDFELRLKFKTIPDNDSGFANSGIQYRSKLVNSNVFIMAGYQADIDAGTNYTGILYEERGRGILALRGQKVVIRDDAASSGKFKIDVTGTTASAVEVESAINKTDWNDYVIIARGRNLKHFINGKLAVDVTDESSGAALKGLIGSQIHVGQPMQVMFKDIRIHQLSTY